MTLAFDLQSHSTHSDGALGAAEVVQRAARAGVELLALSDHDTVSGVSEADQAGERFGVRIVPAVEISSIDDPSAQGEAGTPRELHILGYLIDHTDPSFTATLADFLADRERRTLRMADALREQGLRARRRRDLRACPGRAADRAPPPRRSRAVRARQRRASARGAD